ncbi:M-phase phosphoprotein 9 [Pelodytes ibericus]
MAWDKQWVTQDHELIMDGSTSTKTTVDRLELPTEHCDETAFNERSTNNNGAVTSEQHSPSCDMQTAITRDLCSRKQPDQETRKNCEARWLQLLQLVERQCQEQMVVQQEQFNCQIQVIRDDIKHLIQLQGGGSSWKSCTGDAIVSMGSNTNPLQLDGGSLSRDQKNRAAISSSFSQHSEPDKQQKAFITQEHFLENTSVSSGYGTHSASEPNTYISSCSQNTSKESRIPENTGKGSGTESLIHHNLIQTPDEDERHFIQASDKNCQSSLPDKKPVTTMSEHTAPHFNHNNNETNKIDISNRASLTTWAQKIKKTHKKSNQMAPVPTQANSQTESESMSPCENTDGSPHTFYLSNRTESANSLISAGSGYTYWMLDDKEMYHPLPENFETGFSKFLSTKEEEETRIPSLTDIYQQKQRECPRYPDWKPLSPSEYTHPPEVLTLDPTLHRKPDHHSRLSTRSLPNIENNNRSLTPDSILENVSFSHYDSKSFSSAPSAPSLRESPNRSPSPAVSDQQWENGRYENRVNLSYELSPGDGSCDERMLCTEDDVNSLTPSSMPESPLPFADENIAESSRIHPLMLSNIRRSLREKHSRHLSDLRDYYESEISNLKQQILANAKSPTNEDLEKISSLSERCAHVEGALTEASKRIRKLENKNNELEQLLVEWKERYQTANTNSKLLQEQMEDMRARGKEKENSISRLQSRLGEIEEACEKAFRISDEKETRIKQEHKRFQDLLLEYQSLGKEHERVKDTLCVTENKLYDANSEMNELKRSVSKLEAQIKQLEHENTLKVHHIADSQSLQSSANLNVIHTVGNLRSIDVAKRKCLTPAASCSMFTGQPLDNKNSGNENIKDKTYMPTRYNSPPEKDSSFDIFPTKKNDNGIQESPILKALRDFEEEKALKSWVHQTENQNSSLRLSGRRQTVGFSDCWSSHGSPDNQDRQRRMNSPSGPRSSSVPPSNRKPTTVSTPTKREFMLTPISVKYSPKRSPRENLSPGLSPLLCNEENPMTRFDVGGDSSSTTKDPSPRKRLQFLDDAEVMQKSRSESQLPALVTPYETEFTYNDRMTSLVETERLFDDLSEEKRQIEAALSRVPGAGHRLSLQMRAKKENLEDRLEKINRELGSVRMTLKKYHVLPTPANI